MHVPDGFLNVGTSVAAGVIAAVAVGVALTRAKAEQPTEYSVPMVGLVASFIFAGQMINFPVGAGTSGHLIGAALAAVLVGPWTAVLCLTAVLVVQALLFADGGITALGTNVTLMGVVAVFAAWGVFVLLRMLLPKRAAFVGGSAAVAALVSVPVAALAFTLLYAIGGQVPIDLGLLAGTMIGWHSIIGIGEAIITGVVVSTVVATRPDLVYGLRRFPVTSAPVAREPVGA